MLLEGGTYRRAQKERGSMTDFKLQIFSRLEPRTHQFKGGRIVDTDVLTLDEAAKFASNHAGAEITQGDFLRAAARGEITLRAIVHRTAKLQKHDGGIYCNQGMPTENTAPQGAILTIPLSACQQLASAGRAAWRTFDGFENRSGELMRFTVARLMDSEPDFETAPGDCRVTGDAVHALADEYTDVQAAAPSEAESKDVGETLADNSRVWKKIAMVAELKGIWPSIAGDLSEASREKGGLKAANVRRSYWNVDMCIKWAVANGKITNNQQLKNSRTSSATRHSGATR